MKGGSAWRWVRLVVMNPVVCAAAWWVLWGMLAALPTESDLGRWFRANIVRWVRITATSTAPTLSSGWMRRGIIPARQRCPPSYQRGPRWSPREPSSWRRGAPAPWL